MGSQAYSTGRQCHFDVFRSYRVSAPAGEPDHAWSHDGWEIILQAPEQRLPQENIRLRGRIHSVSQNQFLLFNSREDHTEVYKQDKPSRFDVLLFTNPLLASLFEETNIDSEEVLFANVAHKFHPRLLETLRTIFMLREARSTDRLAFECLGVDLLIELLSHCPSTASEKLKRFTGSGAYPSNVVRAKKVIARNFANADFNLDDLSRQAGISKFHLVRSFKNRTGLSPIQYLNAVKFEVAKSLLEKGMPVSEVSERTGFRTFSAFNKAFKLRAGMAPAKYRRAESPSIRERVHDAAGGEFKQGVFAIVHRGVCK